MKTAMKRVAALAAVLVLGLTVVRAQDDGALLDALVKKGVLSDQEAEDIRASLVKDFANTSAGKLSLSPSIQQLKLYGDGRVRYEYISQKNFPSNATGQSPSTLTDRERYRIRIGADYTYSDHFKAGFELESATGNDTANTTFGGTFNKSAINVGKIYLQYSPTDWATLMVGKFTNPFYCTDLEWDPDIYPEGGAEVLTFNPCDSLSIGLTAGQFYYQENNEAAAGVANGAALNNNDVWMFDQQVPVKWNITKAVSVQVAPGFSFLTGGNGTSTSVGGTASTAQSPTYTGNYGGNYLALVNLPGEVDFKVLDKPTRVYWDTSWNAESDKRINRVYGGQNGQNTTLATQYHPNFEDSFAWLVGAQYGQNKKKKDWSVKADFRQEGLGSLDPTLQDSDWANHYLNQQGVKVQVQYNFTDAVVGSIAYYDTWQLNHNIVPGLGGAATGSQTVSTGGIASEKSSQRVQADIVWKF